MPGMADGGHDTANAVYKATIFKKWGMLDTEGSDKKTVQHVSVRAHAPLPKGPTQPSWQAATAAAAACTHYSPLHMCRHRSCDPSLTPCQVDYTRARHPWLYGHAWVVRDFSLSAKRTDGYGQRSYDVDAQYPTSLVFVAGPNCGARGHDASSTMTRTFNPHAEADYVLFRSGVQAALYAGLMAMARLGSEVALLAHVSAGIYAGPHKARLRTDFEAIVNELLEHTMCDSPSGPAPLGRYFHRVILTLLE